MVVQGGGAVSYDQGSPVPPQSATSLCAARMFVLQACLGAKGGGPLEGGGGLEGSEGALSPFTHKPNYKGTSLIRKRTPLGPYSRTLPRFLWGSLRGGRFLMSEVPL